MAKPIQYCKVKNKFKKIYKLEIKKKKPPAMQKSWVQFLGWKDPLEKGMSTHFSILAWRIP